MKEPRSIFWPLTFITAGLVWLLVSLNIIPAGNIWALTHIWPYVLIAFGLALILRTFWKPFGVIITVLVFLGVFASIYFAPQLKWATPPTWSGFMDWSDVEDWDLGDTSGAVPGSGVVATETRKVSGFDSIKIRYPAEVTITQGGSESLTIETEDNLLPQLATRVESGTLVIENSETSRAKRVHPKEPVKIKIVVKDLEKIVFSTAGTLAVENLASDKLEVSLSGAGEVTLTSLDVRELDIAISGAGTINLDGKADETAINISGMGSFNGKGFTTREASVVISGAGSAHLRVEQKLTAVISGAGSVDYFGNPTVTKQISGAGSVNQQEE
jgi:energy-coupling factor transporter transmembrane protein EcfT